MFTSRTEKNVLKKFLFICSITAYNVFSLNSSIDRVLIEIIQEKIGLHSSDRCVACVSSWSFPTSWGDGYQSAGQSSSIVG